MSSYSLHETIGRARDTKAMEEKRRGNDNNETRTLLYSNNGLHLPGFQLERQQLSRSREAHLVGLSFGGSRIVSSHLDQPALTGGIQRLPEPVSHP